MSTVGIRFLSGLAVGLPVLGIVIWGQAPFSLLIGVLIAVALVEYRGLFQRVGIPVYIVPAVGASWLFCAAVVITEVTPLIEPLMAALLLVLIVITLTSFGRGEKAAFPGMMATLGAIIYVGWMGKHLISLRALDEGLYWTLTVILTTIVADVAAYFAGNAFGKTLLAPKISPNKTWEGALGALIASPLSGALLVVLWNRLGSVINPLHGAALGFLMAALTPLGDFLISTLKRYANAKDSSNLIPGHGGLLDRVDTQIVAGMVGFYYITLFVPM